MNKIQTQCWVKTGGPLPTPVSTINIVTKGSLMDQSLSFRLSVRANHTLHRPGFKDNDC